jgi:hypothetical protein
LTIFLATFWGTPVALATFGDAAAANISLACCLDLNGISLPFLLLPCFPKRCRRFP